MPVATIETKSVPIDDDLTDLSWLLQMNNNRSNKQRYSASNDYHHHETKSTKPERISKPLTVINGPTNRSLIPSFSHNQQYFNEENQFHSQQSFHHQTMKRKYDYSLAYHHQAKRFHSEPTHPIYSTAPLSSESFYYDHPPLSTQQRTSIPTTSRCMLRKNDPSLAQTMPTVHLSTNFNEPSQIIEHENIYSDDIEHLLDIFKNEVEMIGLDPIATTSTGDCTLDMAHCLSANEFCSY